MQSRGLSDIQAQMADDGHPPMASLGGEIAKQPWAGDLWFDTSMLRLLVARSGRQIEDLVITYAGGRGGGRPSDPTLDAFDVAIFDERQAPKLLRALPAGEVIRALAVWTERTDSKS
jgi:hypothetical protein